MRPVLLELEGFGAFRDRTSIDFDGAEQFALVGPTGAGKSTIIDAICFVLYGNVPRYDDHRLVGAAMSMGAAEMRVRLRFDVGGERYVAVRVVRRAGTGKVSTKEARLEREVGGGADSVILAGRESEMRDAIDALLGLSFEDFTRCVVLPQGDFARFLHDKPADRQALLIRLLDLGLYQRLQSRAASSASELDNEIRFIDGKLSELGSSGADLDVLAAEVARLDAVVARLDDAEPEVDGLTQRIVELVAERDRSRLLLTALSAVAVPKDLAERGTRSQRLAADVVAADEALDAASAAVIAAEQAVAEHGAPQRWEDIVRLWERRSRGDTVVGQRTLAASGAMEQLGAANAQVAVAEAAVAGARDALDVVERANRAHVLAVDLQPGEPCPVCEQIVGHLPLPSAPAGLDAARARLARAEASLNRDVAAVTEARVLAATSKESLEQSVALLAEISTQLQGAATADEAQAGATASRQAAAAVDVARATEQRARGTAKSAREALAAEQRGAEAVAGTFHAQRDSVARLDPPTPTDDLAASWMVLHRWATDKRLDVESLIADSATSEQAARDQLAALLDTVSVDAFGTDRRSARDLGELRSAVSVASDRAARDLASEQQRRERTAGLEAERVALGDRRMVATELARLLKADRFQRWLISSTLAELAARASDRLRTMSAGQFSLDLSDNGEFAVVDHRAADERRPVRTLSGGETFQASLALALALAEGLGEMSGRAQRAMDAIFLDEGFGTLDAESLDVVASTIEELAGADGGRMVGVVTHVPALAERMPVRFRVSRDARTASVVREVSA